MLSVTSEKVTIDKKEVCRYLGYGASAPDEKVSAMIDECMEEVVSASELRSFCRSFPLGDKGNAGSAHITIAGQANITIGSLEVNSADLAKNLASCVEVYIFGATIGIGLDRLIARASVSDMMRATIFQAVGAAYIEAYCDVINDELDELAASKGRGTRPRFSPGYGDFSMSHQRDIFELLDLTKHTGISLTEGILMTPSKSVTAIVGVTCEAAECEARDDDTYRPDTADKGQSTGHDCERCDLVDCQFRRNE